MGAGGSPSPPRSSALPLLLVSTTPSPPAPGSSVGDPDTARSRVPASKPGLGKGYSSQSERPVPTMRDRGIVAAYFTEVSVTHPDLFLSLNWIQNNLLVPV